jgi:hypothetical protein
MKKILLLVLFALVSLIAKAQGSYLVVANKIVLYEGLPLAYAKTSDVYVNLYFDDTQVVLDNGEETHVFHVLDTHHTKDGKEVHLGIKKVDNDYVVEFVISDSYIYFKNKEEKIRVYFKDFEAHIVQRKDKMTATYR